MTRGSAFLSLVALLGVALGGCATGSATLRAPAVGHPVSMTSSVMAADGRRIGLEEAGDAGRFEIELTRWFILYGIPLGSRDRDLSERLAYEIESRGGVGIVNLTVDAYLGGEAFLTGLLPVFPHHLSIVVRGDVLAGAGP